MELKAIKLLREDEAVEGVTTAGNHTLPRKLNVMMAATVLTSWRVRENSVSCL
jgi:hypothetical protein